MKRLLYICMLSSLITVHQSRTQNINIPQVANTIVTQLKKIDSIAQKIMSTKIQSSVIAPDVRATEGITTISDADYNTLYDLLGAINTAAKTISQYPFNSPITPLVIDSISKINNPFFKKLSKDFSWVKDWTHKTAYQPSQPLGDDAISVWVHYISDNYLSYLGYDTSAFIKLNNV